MQNGNITKWINVTEPLPSDKKFHHSKNPVQIEHYPREITWRFVNMMLRYTFNQDESAYRIEAAVKQVLAQGFRTADIHETGTRKVGTRETPMRVAAL